MDIFDGRPFKELFQKFLNQPRIGVVPKLKDLELSEFRSVFEKLSLPVILNGKSVSRILGASALKILKDEYSDVDLKVRFGSYGSPENYIERRDSAPMKLGELFKLLFSNEATSTYAGNQTPPSGLLERLGVSPPSYFDRALFEPAAMWLGSKGSITPLHKDGSDNFAVHVSGRKRWVIFPPRDAIHLYMRRVSDESDFSVSAIDLRSPDLDKHPAFASAMPIETVIEAGETLFLPAGWSHYVENLEPSLMFNFWIRERQKPT